MFLAQQMKRILKRYIFKILEMSVLKIKLRCMYKSFISQIPFIKTIWIYITGTKTKKNIYNNGMLQENVYFLVMDL
jgi:hypothetical protein